MTESKRNLKLLVAFAIAIIVIFFGVWGIIFFGQSLIEIDPALPGILAFGGLGIYVIFRAGSVGWNIYIDYLYRATRDDEKV